MVWKQLHETKSRQSHPLDSGYKHKNIWTQVGKAKIWKSSKRKLLGVVIDRCLSFNEYVSSLCKQAVSLQVIVSFIKIIKSNEFSTKETFNKTVCRSLVWILPISLDVSWQKIK